MTDRALIASGKARLAYILSASHSGSTLLAMLLNTHPDICTVGELKATALGDLHNYRCSCGEFIRHCPFWARVRELMTARGLPLNLADPGTHFSGNGSKYLERLLKPLHRGPVLEALRDAALGLSSAWRRQLAASQRRNAELARTVLELTAARVIVDSSKIALRLKYLLRNSELDVKVIRLIRDGRAVALTYTDPYRFADASRAELRGGGTGANRDDERLSMTHAAREWRRSNEEAEQLLARLPPGRWTQVRYESLCAEPDATLSRLWEFLGLGPGPAVRGFRRVEHHVLGNGMRLDAGEDIRADDRWNTLLGPGELTAFEAEAGPGNRSYGYR